MPRRKKHAAEEIVAKLRQVEVLTRQGTRVASRGWRKWVARLPCDDLTRGQHRRSERYCPGQPTRASLDRHIEVPPCVDLAQRVIDLAA